jgi:acetolactate synthase-1/2/3 large subunit
VAQAVKARTGGRLVAETLEALGIEVAFGVPGVHALAIWDGLRTSPIRTIGFRTELNAGFAADGYARATGKPAALLLSTGPGALVSLASLMEAASSHVPMVAISSQIPRDLIGAGRGYLHELGDQKASFAPIVKWSTRADSHEQIPELLSEAWQRAQTPPPGPVFLEIPVDLLQAETDVSAATEKGTSDRWTLPSPGDLGEAARILNDSDRPVVWAGGGLLRSGAWGELVELARKLDAPVATTYMGKGAFPADDDLFAGSGCDEGGLKELLEDADVVLAVGTELGAETTAQYRLAFSGTVIQIDAAPERFGRTYPVRGLAGDAKAVLSELVARAEPKQRDGPARATRVHERRIAAGLDDQDRDLEWDLLTTIRSKVPAHGVTAWDMTILAYWAAAHFPVLNPRTFLYPLGSGTLGYAWPAALGASVGAPGSPCLAVVGDGGFLYGVQELATARQYGLDAVVLVVDDGGYGILREYQRDSFGETTAVDLVEPDYASVAEAFGVAAERTTPENLGAALEQAFARGGPALVHVPVLLSMWEPTA